MIGHRHNELLIIPFGMVGLIILTGAFLTSPNTNADGTVDLINITVESRSLVPA